jgi:hypothetical protein
MPIILDLITQTVLSEEYGLWSSSLCNFLYPVVIKGTMKTEEETLLSYSSCFNAGFKYKVGFQLFCHQVKHWSVVWVPSADKMSNQDIMHAAWRRIVSDSINWNCPLGWESTKQ